MNTVSSLASLRKRLRIPVIQAPMFVVSQPAMVIAASKSGIVGSFPASTARTIDELEKWLRHISDAVGPGDAPWAINIIAHRSNARVGSELELVMEAKPEIVVTSLGSPRDTVARVKGYGGLVFADVVTPEQARKAAQAGVDGLILLCAGAGGNTGWLSPFAFLFEVRRFFDGLLVLAGGINSGGAIRAAEVMGADLTYMGTQFLASEESMASSMHKQSVVQASCKDVIVTDKFTGIPASILKASLARNNINLDGVCRPEFDLDILLNLESSKMWKDVWAAGQGVAGVAGIAPVAAIVRQLEQEYLEARSTERLQLANSGYGRTVDDLAP